MAHNGGKLQVGPWFIQYGGYFPFINNLKTAQNWAHNNGGTLPAPDEMDSNGYPNAAAGSATWATKGGVYTVFGIPNPSDRPGQYVVKWIGEGTIALTGATVASGYSLTNIGAGTGGGRAVVNIAAADNSFKKGAASISFKITGRGSSSYISHAAFVHIDDEAAYDTGQIFGGKFKQQLIAGGCGVIRYLDWMDGSSSTHARLDHEKPVGNFSYHGGYYRPDLWGGTTTNVGDDYSIDAPQKWNGLVDRATVCGMFNVDAVGNNSTLKVGGTDPKPFLSWDSLSPPAEYYTKPAAGIYFYAIYDQHLDAWIKKGGADNKIDAKYHANAIDSCVPMSVMVQLANEIGAHPWFTIPPMCLDPLTDYVSALINYCKNNLASGLVPRFEPANEVWNDSPGFKATYYADAKEKVHSGGTAVQDRHNWYGRVLSKLGQAVSAAYGNDRSKYQVICGVQTRNTSNPVPRLASTRLVSETGNANDAAKFWATHIAYTCYWNPSYNLTQEMAVAYEYPTASTQRKAEILAGFINNNTLNTDAANYAYWKAWAAGFGITGLCQYEGGFSPDYPTGNITNTASMATKASQAVLTLDTSTSVPPAGVSVKLTGVDGMTELNGNTYTIAAQSGSNLTLNVDTTGFGSWFSASITNITKASSAVVTLAGGSAVPTVGNKIRISGVVGMTNINNVTATVTAVSGLDVTINVNSTAYSTYTSGGTMVSCATVEIIGSMSLINGFRETSKNCPDLVRQTLRNWNNHTDIGGEFPSIYVLSGPTNAWSVLDPSIYVADPPQWQAAKLFNQGKRRIRVT